MKFEIYESHTVVRRIITEADSEVEAIRNWRDDRNCKIDPDFYDENEDYDLEEVNEIREEN